MRNRPGRIFYMLEFKGLSEDFIREYCQDNLSNLTHVDRICSIASLFSQFNFDMLKALVEEMNRYDEAPEDAMRMLNAKPEFDAGKVKYTATIQVEGEAVKPDNFDSSWIGNPLNDSVRIDYRIDLSGTAEDGNNYEYHNVNVSTSDLKKIDSQAGKFVFVSLDGTVVTLQRVKETEVNFYNAL